MRSPLDPDAKTTLSAAEAGEVLERQVEEKAVQQVKLPEARVDELLEARGMLGD